MANVVTKILPLEKDPNLRSVYVDDECVAILTANALDLLKIEVGRPWDKQTTDTVLAHEDETYARSIAMDLISRRMWGSNELEERLIHRGINEHVAAQTIAALIEDAWLDDSAFATALIVELTRVEPASKKWLTKKLRDKRIDPEIAAKAIEDAFVNSSQQDAATAFAVGRVTRSSDSDLENLRKKVLGALQRRGFTSEESFEAVRSALDESSS